MLQNEKLVVDAFLEKVAAASRKVLTSLSAVWPINQILLPACKRALLLGQQHIQHAVSYTST